MPKQRIYSDYSMDDFFRYYKKKTETFGNPDRSNKFNINRTVYTKFLNRFFEEISKAIIEDCMEFKLPGQIGEIRIRKKKYEVKINPDNTLNRRAMRINWQDTIKLWNKKPELREKNVYVYFDNKHTDYYIVSWYWKKQRKSYCHGISDYCFIPTRTNKRNLAKHFKANPKKYYM